MLLTLCSCNTKIIDEKYAIEIAKKELSLSGNISSQVLKGGSSGAKVFAVTSGSNKYIVRFTQPNTSQEYRKTALYNLKVASDAGYGPKVYFMDSSRGIVITEYLSGTKIQEMDFAKYILNQSPADSLLQSGKLCILLANLLRKIHHGPVFKNTGYDVADWIDETLKNNKFKFSPYIPVAKFEQMMKDIRKAVKPHFISTVPCHNDLNKSNLIITESEIKAIDYDNARQYDPYFDIATVLIEFEINPLHENLLLTTYLGRQSSTEEMAKLHLMKQVVRLNIFLHNLEKLKPETLVQYGLTEEYRFIDLVREFIDGKLNFSKTADRLKFLKAECKKIIDNFESHEFMNAIKTLEGSNDK